MGSEVLISFIVPVYNVDKYLSACLDSIFDAAADDSEYEVIAVDDGSTDSCPEILKTYKDHENFRIITQENRGPSLARNAGIDAARGKYICFIDSDDFLIPAVVPWFLNIARKSDQDIIEFDFEHVDQHGKSRGHISPLIGRTPRMGKGKDICAKWHWENFFVISACARFFKRELLIGNSLYFLPGIHREDFEWVYRCFFYADTFIYHPMAVYNYRRRPGSIVTMSLRNHHKTCHDIFVIVDALEAFRSSIERNEENAAYLSALGDAIPQLLDTAINTLMKSKMIKDERDEIFAELVKRRRLLALAVKKKRRLLYLLTRFMPAKAAFRIYKIF